AGGRRDRRAGRGRRGDGAAGEPAVVVVPGPARVVVAVHRARGGGEGVEAEVPAGDRLARRGGEAVAAAARLRALLAVRDGDRLAGDGGRAVGAAAGRLRAGLGVRDADRVGGARRKALDGVGAVAAGRRRQRRAAGRGRRDGAAGDAGLAGVLRPVRVGVGVD